MKDGHHETRRYALHGGGCWFYQLVCHNMNVTLVEALPQILSPLDVEMVAYFHNDLIMHGMDVIVNDGI